MGEAGSITDSPRKADRDSTKSSRTGSASRVRSMTCLEPKMRVSSELDSIARELSRRGAPRAYITRLVDELAVHREELIRDLLSDGLSPEAAEAEADRRIGDPVT